jgi:hypothetical protein
MKINLPNVTLVAADCTDKIMKTIEAMNISSEGIRYGETILFSHKKPDIMPSYFRFEKIPKIENLDMYSYFMFKELGKYVNTSHCLTVQADGYVINPNLWDDSWLQWDYIGACWEYSETSYIAWGSGEHIRNGNGGFSLRSKKILQIPIDHDLPLLQECGYFNEDGNLTCYYNQLMLALGVKYAPVEVAARFSYENEVPENKYIKDFFGFHKHDPRIVRRYNE